MIADRDLGRLLREAARQRRADAGRCARDEHRLAGEVGNEEATVNGHGGAFFAESWSAPVWRRAQGASNGVVVRGKRRRSAPPTKALEGFWIVPAGPLYCLHGAAEDRHDRDAQT